VAASIVGAVLLPLLAAAIPRASAPFSSPRLSHALLFTSAVAVLLVVFLLLTRRRLPRAGAVVASNVLRNGATSGVPRRRAHHPAARACA